MIGVADQHRFRRAFSGVLDLYYDQWRPEKVARLVWFVAVPFVLGFIAIAMIAIGIRGQAQAAGTLLASEFTGAGSFIQWFLAIMILGLIGYYKPAKPVADAMLGLVIVAMVLVRGNPNAPGGGFIAQLENAFQTATPTAGTPASGSGTSGQTGASPSAGSVAGVNPLPVPASYSSFPITT